MNLSNSNPESIARAMIEGMLSGLADAVDALATQGVAVNRIFLVGGAAKNPAVAQIASSLFAKEVVIPPVGEYVADGVARQAAWALLGDIPAWDLGKVTHVQSKPSPEVLEKYRALRDATVNW